MSEFWKLSRNHSPGKDTDWSYKKISEIEKSLLDQGVKTVVACAVSGNLHVFGPMVASCVAFDLEKLLSKPVYIGYPTSKTINRYTPATLDRITTSVRSVAISQAVEEMDIQEIDSMDNLFKSGRVIVQAAYNQLTWQLKNECGIEKEDIVLISSPRFNVFSDVQVAPIENGYFSSLTLWLAYVVAHSHFRRICDHLIYKMSLEKPGIDELYQIKKTAYNLRMYSSKLLPVFRELGPTPYHRKSIVARMLASGDRKATEDLIPTLTDPSSGT